jgi:GntR family transcriptional regulator, transcriptional repressor for pyruvate dehydrogenase complex
MEMRASVGADAARRAATRADGVQRAEIEARAEMLAAETGLDARNTLYEAFWDLIIDASDNLAYRLALNTLASGRQLVVDARRIGPELADDDAIRRLARAIAAGEEEAALTLARALLERSA